MRSAPAPGLCAWSPPPPAFVKIGSSPTATSGDVYLPADKPEIFIVNPGETASAIQVASGGTLHVTELA